MSILIYFSNAPCYIICLSIGEPFQTCSLVIDLLRAQENAESVLGVTQDTGSPLKTPPTNMSPEALNFYFGNALRLPTWLLDVSFPQWDHI